MTMSLALTASLVSAAVPVNLAGEILRVGDVAIVTTGRDLSILRLPAGRRAVTLDRETVHALIANRLPGVPFRLREQTTLRIVRGRGVARSPGECTRARLEIASGTLITDDMVDRGPCDGAVLRLGYDRVQRTPIAREDIAAGANLGPVRVAAEAPLAAGRTLTLRTQTGPVTIERQVITLQPGHPGGRVFVKTQDGAVLASRLTATAR